jgi:hypothetical protein
VTERVERLVVLVAYDGFELLDLAGAPSKAPAAIRDVVLAFMGAAEANASGT